MLDNPRRNAATREAWHAGYTVRRDWADGTHEMISFRWTALAAAKVLDRDRRYWRRGPMRPASWAIVVISKRDFDLHAERHECRSPDCPSAVGAMRRVQAQR